MLVKLGDVWVDPILVNSIDHITNKDDDIFVRVFYSKESSEFHCIDFDEAKTEESALLLIDNFAAIINNASQSFGGSEDEKSEGK